MKMVEKMYPSDYSLGKNYKLNFFRKFSIKKVNPSFIQFKYFIPYY